MFEGTDANACEIFTRLPISLSLSSPEVGQLGPSDVLVRHNLALSPAREDRWLRLRKDNILGDNDLPSFTHAFKWCCGMRMSEDSEGMCRLNWRHLNQSSIHAD